MYVYKKKGFTLIEIIITLVVGVLLAALAIQVAGIGRNSPQPVRIAETQAALLSAAERLTEAYRKEITEKGNTFNLDTFLADQKTIMAAADPEERVTLTTTEKDIEIGVGGGVQAKVTSVQVLLEKTDKATKTDRKIRLYFSK